MGRVSIWASWVIVAALGGLFAAERAGAAEVEFELVTEPGFPIDGSRDWLEMLAGMGQTQLRIRQMQPGDRPEVQTRGSETRRTYRVMGVLTRNNHLRVPGGEFSLRDKRALSEWIEKLKLGGQDALQGDPRAFGLTEQEIVALHEQLARPVDLSTQGQPLLKTLDRIAGAARLELQLDLQQRSRLLRSETTIAQELNGISLGTALAVLANSERMVIVPERAAGNRIVLRGVPETQAKEFWPVGWPPEKPPGQIAPSLFKYLKVEIAPVPLSEALATIGQRIEVPILIDQSGLAAAGIDPLTVKVTMPEGRTFYKRILDHLLAQAKLKGDLRVDEAGKPFLWVTPVVASRR